MVVGRSTEVALADIDRTIAMVILGDGARGEGREPFGGQRNPALERRDETEGSVGELKRTVEGEKAHRTVCNGGGVSCGVRMGI